MDGHEPQRYPVRVATAEHTNIGRVLAMGTIVLWLVTMLLIMEPAVVRGLF